MRNLKRSLRKSISSLLIFVLLGCSTQTNVSEEVETTIQTTTTTTVSEVVEPEPIPDTVLSFVAVGDNLIHGAVFKDAFIGNNTYDFKPMYQYIKPYIEDKDVAFINQETIIGGKEIGLSHYPYFNSPEDLIEAIADTGFDLVNTASNHSMDKGEVGILNALNFFDEYPELTVAGTNRSYEEQNTLRIIEREGLKIGFMAYTYSINGLSIPDGKYYLVNMMDKETTPKEVAEAKKQVDILIVSLHYGTEDSHIVNDYQKEYTKLLNEAGADVIIGTHPHVIQPMEIVTNEESGHQTFVMYSLGNFLSAQIKIDEILEGMVMWDMRYNHETKTISFENIKYYPLVDHFDQGYVNFRVYTLAQYSDELAKKHGLTFSKSQLQSIVDSVMGDEWEIIY